MSQRHGRHLSASSKQLGGHQEPRHGALEVMPYQTQTQNCMSTWEQCCGHKRQWQLALKCVKLKAAWRAIMCTHRVIQQKLANHDLLTIPSKLSSCFEEKTVVQCQVKSVDKSGDKNYKRRIALEIEVTLKVNMQHDATKPIKNEWTMRPMWWKQSLYHRAHRPAVASCFNLMDRAQKVQESLIWSVACQVF